MAIATKPVLKLGDEGIFVNNLQTTLWKLGYLEREYITSVFDFKTEHAVKSFQSDWSIRIDGIVGEETWGTLKTALQGVTPSTMTLGIWNWIRQHKTLSSLLFGLTGFVVYLVVKKR